MRLLSILVAIIALLGCGRLAHAESVDSFVRLTFNEGNRYIRIDFFSFNNLSISQKEEEELHRHGIYHDANVFIEYQTDRDSTIRVSILQKPQAFYEECGIDTSGSISIWKDDVPLLLNTKYKRECLPNEIASIRYGANARLQICYTAIRTHIDEDLASSEVSSHKNTARFDSVNAVYSLDNEEIKPDLSIAQSIYAYIETYHTTSNYNCKTYYVNKPDEEFNGTIYKNIKRVPNIEAIP